MTNSKLTLSFYETLSVSNIGDSPMPIDFMILNSKVVPTNNEIPPYQNYSTKRILKENKKNIFLIPSKSNFFLDYLQNSHYSDSLIFNEALRFDSANYGRNLTGMLTNVVLSIVDKNTLGNLNKIFANYLETDFKKAIRYLDLEDDFLKKAI